MHQSSDITIESLTKIEGNAALDVKITDGRVEYAHFIIAESKRFFTRSIEGKPIAAVPQLLSRICGTCSVAHLMCSIEACEHALGITPSAQTMLLRHLTMYGMYIRDHALHLYLFAMPDIFGKDAFLDFDENDPKEHQLLHDCFDVKAAGNYLATIVSGRVVHAMHPTLGGFLHFPTQAEVAEAIKKLEAVRPAVLRLIDVFAKADFHFDRGGKYMALKSADRYSFLEGEIVDSQGEHTSEVDFADFVEHVVHPYSEASAYQHEGETFMVGALARLNLQKGLLHPVTIKSTATILERFPSTDVFDNNLAQAIETLHSLDEAIDLLRQNTIEAEPVNDKPTQHATGVGVVEAPRGLLYHKIEVGDDGLVKRGQIIVPTGQNQISIEEDIMVMVQRLLDQKVPREKIVHELEKLVRAYDPCISCSTHFLKVNWL